MHAVSGVLRPRGIYAAISGAATFGVVYMVARRILSAYSQALPLAMGAFAGGLAGYLVSRSATISLQTIKPSDSFEGNNKVKVGWTIATLARNEAQLHEIKIPGLFNWVVAALQSSNINEVQASETLLKEDWIAGLQIGAGDEWILPQGGDEQGFVTLEIGHESLKLRTTPKGCAKILEKLGIKSSDGTPFKSIYNLELDLENSQVNAVRLYNKNNVQIGEAIEIESKDRCEVRYEKGLQKMPPPSESFNPYQKKVANILINTIWLNPQYQDKREWVKNALKSGFQAVLATLAELAFEGHGKMLVLGNAILVNRMNIVNDDRLLQGLCSSFNTLNHNEPHKTVFKLERIRSLTGQLGIPLIYGAEQIAMDQNSLTSLIKEVAEMLVIKAVVDAYDTVPAAYWHDSADTDPEYQKNWRGWWYKDGLLATTRYWSQTQCFSGEMNITEAVRKLPRAEEIQKVDIDDTKVVFTLKSPGKSHVVFFPEPDPGNDRTKNYSRNRPKLEAKI
ncbi:MAG: hypothetical protein ABSA17_06410 [Rhabdochlamydiaceae bacterium]|jgi:hypothetical protein